ncbi:MAG: efflux RND transporter periplasmic adaptor subunit [Clostridiaceae bacterium]|nr:efflux RND transporter periplasmic adaptor subunit [Clostridiaceae bacterium]
MISSFEKAVILNITYTTGNITVPTQKSFTIVDLNSLIVEANVVEEFISDVKIGAFVRIVPVADRTKTYEGEVISISKMAFQKNGETVIPVSISINNINDFLIPNYNVDVFIEITNN